MLGLGIRKRILEWLLKDVLIEEIRVRRLRVGNTIDIPGDYIDMSPLTSDPSLAEGRMWYRSDENVIKYSDGVDVINPVGVLQIIPMAIHYDYLTGTGTKEHRYGARSYIDLGVMGTAYFCTSEKISADNQDRAISLENLTDGVVVAQYTSNTGLADTYHWHKMPFTPPSGYKEYRVTFTNNTASRYDVYGINVQSGTEIKDLYLVKLVEIERLGYRLKIPEICLRKNITYGIHAYNFKDLAVIQVAPKDVRTVENLRHEMDIERFRVEELREVQRKWRWNIYV